MGKLGGGGGYELDVLNLWREALKGKDTNLLMLNDQLQKRQIPSNTSAFS